MPTIPITKMPDRELVRLINAASAELMRRAEQQPRPERPAAVPMEPHAPPEADKILCLSVAQRLRSGDYIRADERQRVASIAEKFGPWVRLQRLPTEPGTGPWRKAAEMYRRGFAKEN